MRPSELAALRWASLDLRAGTLAVSEAAPVVGGKGHVGPPKSAAGKRVLRLEPALVAVLHAHRAGRLERRLLLGDRWQDHDLVCPSDVGMPIQHRNLGRLFHELCTAACVPHIRPYDLRHTTTNIMIASGAYLKAAGEVRGHADPTITQRVYQHVTGAMRDRAVTLLSGALSEGTGAAPAEQAAI